MTTTPTINGLSPASVAWRLARSPWGSLLGYHRAVHAAIDAALDDLDEGRVWVAEAVSLEDWLWETAINPLLEQGDPEGYWDPDLLLTGGEDRCLVQLASVVLSEYLLTYRDPREVPEGPCASDALNATKEDADWGP